MVDIPLAESIVHEDYKPYSRDHENDIALLRLNQSVEFTDWIKPLCLPIASVLRDKDYGNETVLTVAGWGRVSSIFYTFFTFFLSTLLKSVFFSLSFQTEVGRLGSFGFD